MTIELLNSPASQSTPLQETEAALALDTKLRFLATAEMRVQRMMGAGLSRLFDSHQLISLGPAKPADYVKERLGISLREAQELVRIERLIPQYPETDRLWQAGRISRCHVREILCRVPPEDDFAWARLAATMTVRQLKDRLIASGLKPLSAPDDEDDGKVFEFKASPELHAKWLLGMELANRFWGRDVGPAGFLDTCVMEATSEASDELYRKLDEAWEPPSRHWRDEVAELRADRERYRERETQNWSSLNWEADDPVIPDLTLPDGADVFAIDETLRMARTFLQEVTGLLMRTLWQARRLDLAQALRFNTLEHYASERLGMSPSKVNGLLRLRRALLGFRPVEEAYATGVLSQCQAEQVVRVAVPATVDAWIDYARQTTVRKLRDVVARGLSLPRPQTGLWPPELQMCACPEARKLLETVLAQVGDPTSDAIGPLTTPLTCAPADPEGEGPGRGVPLDAVTVPDDPYLLPGEAAVTVRFRLSSDIEEFIEQGIGLCRVVLGPTATVARCVELLVDTFLLEYLREAQAAVKEHQIPERDGWRCIVPGCTNRLVLQVHHLEFRSQGGSDEASNLGTLCAAHHLQGIHAGRLVAKGLAPNDIVWVMGLQSDGKPSQVFVGDRQVYSAN